MGTLPSVLLFTVDFSLELFTLLGDLHQLRQESDIRTELDWPEVISSTDCWRDRRAFSSSKEPSLADLV